MQLNHFTISSALICFFICSTHAAPQDSNAAFRACENAANTRVTSLGFDLSASYGAVAISFHNGTQLVLGCIDGDDEYKQFMAGAAAGDGRAGPFPGTPNEEAIFGKMLRALRAKAEHQLGYKIEAALVATPNLPGERTGILGWALQSMNLKNLDHMVKDSPNGFRQTPAAEAGTNLGLCQNYHDTEACKREQNAMPPRYVLSILFTSNSLCVEVAEMRSPYRYYSYPTYPTSMDFSLGYDKHDQGPDGGDSYWEAVKQRIMRGILGAFPSHKPDLVLMYGDADAVANPRLRNVVDEATLAFTGKRLPIYDHDPMFVVVRGAAELAKRGSWPYLDIFERKTVQASPGIDELLAVQN